MGGILWVVGSQFVVDDSLAILEIHRVGLVFMSNPVETSLKNNYTGLSIELETYYHLIFRIIPHLDLADLSLWLADLDAGPVIVRSLGATIGTIPQSELVLKLVCFIHGDKVIVVALERGG